MKKVNYIGLFLICLINFFIYSSDNHKAKLDELKTKLEAKEAFLQAIPVAELRSIISDYTQIWQEEKNIQPKEGYPKAIAYSKNNKHLICLNVYCGQRYLNRYEVKNGYNFLDTLVACNYDDCLAFSDKYLFVVIMGGIIVYDAENYSYMGFFPSDSPVHCLAVSKNNNHLASGQTGLIQIWDISTLKLLKTIDHGSGNVMSIDYSNDNKHFAATNQAGKLKIFDVNDNYKLIDCIDKYLRADVSVAYSKDNKYLAIGIIGSNKIKILDVNDNYKVIHETTQMHEDHIVALKFSNYGKYLASGSLDGAIKIWNTQSFSCLFDVPNCLISVQGAIDFSNDGRSLAVAGMSKKIIIFRLHDINSMLE